jgi:hypothetical protein
MKEEVNELLKQFYKDCDQVYMAGEFGKLRQLYEQICLKLEEKMPVQRMISPEIETALNINDRLIVAVNHIPTPNLFAISDEHFIRALGINPPDLHLNVIHPLVVRHYPLVNFFKQYNFKTHMVGREEPEPLSSFYHGWENLTIPEKGKNRSRIISDLIETFSEKRWALVMFPEGQDSHDDLAVGIYQQLPFKKGFAVLAQKHNLPVLPISLRFDVSTFSYAMTVHTLVSYTTKIPVEELITRVQETVGNSPT